MKKSEKSGSEYYNYEGFFSLVLLSLVDAECKFLWVNVGSSGSSSNAQIYKLRKKIKDGTFGLPSAKLLGGGSDLHYCLLGDDTITLMSWLVKPYRRQLTREEKIANYRIFRGWRVVENVFRILASRFRVSPGTMEQRPKVVRDITLTCVALENMLMTHQGQADRAPNPADDIASLQNEQVVYVISFEIGQT